MVYGAVIMGGGADGKAEDAELRPGSTHVVTLTRNDGGTQRVQARWVLDATGRYSLLKRARVVEEHRGKLQDFKVPRDYPYGVEQVYSDATFADNVRLVEWISGQLIKTILDEGALADDNEPMRTQVERWRADTELMRLVAIYEQDHAAGIVDSDWVPAQLARS